MEVSLTVATANINRALSRREAGEALELVLARRPDLIGLQEWGWSRSWLLGYRDYQWYLPVFGGTVMGARRDRFGVRRTRGVILDAPERAERPDRLLGLEPPRLLCTGRYVDEADGTPVSLLVYHLAPGVQVGTDGYREDRPVLAARHRREVARVEELIAAERRRGAEVYAVGDANFDQLRLAGVTSCWRGREDWQGTLGTVRKVDDVQGRGPAVEVTVVANASDHDAVVAVRRRAWPVGPTTLDR